MTALLDHFHEAITTVEDVQKLKRFILQLAMQGKLVEQDPNDEPASELLRRIEAEKKQLIMEKKIKKLKPLPQITEDEKQFELPGGWEWIRLGNIGDWGAGATPVRGNSEYYNGNIPWLKTGELNDGYIKKSEEFITELALQKTSLRLNKPGDVLIAMYGATIGKLGILTFEATTNQACCACTPFNGVYNKFLFYFLLSQRDYYRSLGAGGAQPNISKDKITKSVIPLPSTNEQKRIVKKIEIIFSQCDQLLSDIVRKQTKSKFLNTSVFTRLQDHNNPSQIEDLRFVINNIEHLCDDKTSINQLRNSLVSLAVQGRIVQQDANDEPASVLLEKIREAKERLIKEKKIKGDKPLPPIAVEEVPYELPKGWEWVRLNNLCEIIADIDHKMPKAVESGGVKFLSAKDLLDDGTINFDNNIKYISEKDFERLSKKIIPRKGDIIYSRIGAKLGKSRIVDREEKFLVSYSCCTIRPLLINTNYLNYYLDSGEVLEQAKELTQSIGVPDLGMQKIKSFLIPVPPLNEQKRIVEKLNKIIRLLNHKIECVDKHNIALNNLIKCVFL